MKEARRGGDWSFFSFNGELTPPLLQLECRVTKLRRKWLVLTHFFPRRLVDGLSGARSRSSYKTAGFHVRRGQVGLENISQLSWGFLKCIYVGTYISVKGNEGENES